MKTTFTLLCAALFAISTSAQEVAPPLPESPDAPLLPDEPLLIPDDPAPIPPRTYVPDDSSLPLESEVPEDTRPAPTFSKTQASLEELKNRIKMREARIKAERDPAVQEAKARARAANTFPARRDAMGVYYDRLFMRMKKIDGSIRERVDIAHADYRRNLLQPRISVEDEAIVNASKPPAATAP